MAGGYGTRVKELTSIYKCKTLIPIAGKPCIEWVINELNKLRVRKIFLSIDREELLPLYNEVIERNAIENVVIHRQYGKHASGEVILDLEDELEDTFILTYGNNPVSHVFYRSMIDTCKDEVLGLSLYSMQTSTSKRIVTKEGDKIKNLVYYENPESYNLRENEFFFDKPLLLNKKFIRYLVGEDLRSTPALRKWQEDGNTIRGFITNFPPEFHYKWEIDNIEKYIQSELADFGSH